jgi:hypothetical protein
MLAMNPGSGKDVWRESGRLAACVPYMQAGHRPPMPSPTNKEVDGQTRTVAWSE